MTRLYSLNPCARCGRASRPSFTRAFRDSGLMLLDYCSAKCREADNAQPADKSERELSGREDVL